MHVSITDIGRRGRWLVFNATPFVVNRITTRMNVCLQENLELLQAQDDSEIWTAYVDYVDEVVVEGFFNTIQCSLKFLIDNTSPRPEPASLFEAILELKVTQ